MTKLTVIIPAHNPGPGRLRRVLAGLRAQTLPAGQWETLLVDNASTPALALPGMVDDAPEGMRVVREERPGLTPARLRGFAEARGEVLVLVDDDNVLAPDYLANIAARFSNDPGLGAAGGRARPEFEAPPPAWTREFDGLLALRDLGEEALRASWQEKGEKKYPLCAPIGAGMALRRAAAEAYAAALDRDPRRRALDRQGERLVSGGDNDLVMTILEAGFHVAYFPELILTHLIPRFKSEKLHLGALNRAIARSWVRVLAFHGIVIWRPIPRWTVRPRQWRAWWRAGAWRSPAHWVRWQGLCGTFEGQAE